MFALAQIERFAPDVLWYDHHDPAFLERIRARCRSVRAVVGWVGSALPDSPLWRACDLVLSCAPSRSNPKATRGTRGLLLHAFNERVLEGIAPRRPTLAVSFVGQIAPDHPLHAHRERLLDALLATRTSRCSALGPRRRPSRPPGRSQRRGLSAVTSPAAGRRGRGPAPPHPAGGPRGPLAGGAARQAARAPRPRPAPGAFGLDMFQTLRDSSSR